MPLQIVCSGCGHIIYEGSMRSPDDILNVKGDKCPKCGRTLATSPIMVKVGEKRFNEDEIKSLIRGR